MRARNVDANSRPEGRDRAVWLEAESHLIDGRRVAEASAGTSPPRSVAFEHMVPAHRPMLSPTAHRHLPISRARTGAPTTRSFSVRSRTICGGVICTRCFASSAKPEEVQRQLPRYTQWPDADSARLEQKRCRRDRGGRENPPLPQALRSDCECDACAHTPCLVIVNHHEDRIFLSSLRGTAAEQVLPHDPDHFLRYAPNSKDFARGREKPDTNSFFAPVARALETANQILIFGSGTGTSNDVDQFVVSMHCHQPELARRIVGSLVVDEHHLTDGQLLARARDFYATTRQLRSQRTDVGEGLVLAVR